MNRRSFLHLAAATPLLAASVDDNTPSYHIVCPYGRTSGKGMPGPYPGRVVRVHSENSINAESEKVNAEVVRSMISRGIRQLTGDSSDRDAWSRFISKDDVVGIKVNCSGAPNIMSTPEVVGDIARNLIEIGVPAGNIYVYERFWNQLESVHYERFVPAEVHIHAAENQRGSILGYDPDTYVEVSFFGEEDTRSNLTRLVSEKLTKIINVPNMKEHQAAGVTGCLKNIAYGNFSNMDRSHQWEKTNTRTFIGTLANMEPVRSKTVLHVMDGLRGVWHAGPFSRDRKFRFYPKQMMFGTDPVAMDRLLIDVIDDKRKAEGAPSVWDRSDKRVRFEGEPDPQFNHFIREPGHIEYAGTLGLGVYDIHKIDLKIIAI